MSLHFGVDSFASERDRGETVRGGTSRQPRWVVWAAGLFVVQTVGFLGVVAREGTPLGAVWVLDLGFPKLAAELANGAVAWLVGLGGLAAAAAAGAPLLLRRFAFPLVALTCVAGLVLLLQDWIEVAQGHHMGSFLAPAAHAVRYAIPLGLALLWTGRAPRPVLRGWTIAAGAVFLAHGIECLLGHPVFIDFLVTVPRRWLGGGPSLDTASTLLVAIGVLDVVVGLAAIVRPQRKLMLWMAFWGFLTASVRLLYFGRAGWPDALIRVTNGGMPLLLALAFTFSAPSPKPRS